MTLLLSLAMLVMVVQAQGTDLPPPDGSPPAAMEPLKDDMTPPNVPAVRPAGPGRKFTTTRPRRGRSTPYQMSFLHYCDYIAFYCFRASSTGVICGRSYFQRYYTFTSYCILEYVNCREKWDVWEIAYVGMCGHMTFSGADVQKVYPYENDYFLDQYYAIEYGQPGK